MSSKRSSRTSQVLKTGAVWILSAVIAGIIGNRADSVFVNTFPSIQEYRPVPVWLILFVICISIASLILLILFFIKVANERKKAERKLEDTRRVAARIVELDETLLRLLPGMSSADTSASNKLLEALFRAMARVFNGDVTRGSVLLPDPNDPDYLVPIYDYGMPVGSVNLMHFYIGSNDNIKRGIAGMAYHTREVKIVHLSQEIDKWVASDPNYIFLDEGHPPRYRSFVVVPITDAITTSSLGVLCLDSMSPDIFDSPDLQYYLLSLGSRVGTVISLYNRLNQPPSL